MAEGSSSPEEVSVTCFAPFLRYRGLLKRNIQSDDEYAAFHGIPYARIPVGLERYQAPKPPVRPYRPLCPAEVYDATLTKSYSRQFSNKNKLIGSVDCLYLNIYLPKRPESIEGLLPVLVFFHGGGFSTGSIHPDFYPPDFIIQHNVIFVTVAYRLGLLGFLNMHEKICPGNAGLKDQVQALEWIRDNIEEFRGDPKNVTISGGSAGASCVNLHLVAPMSKGLFHKAIVQSGGVYSYWGYRGHQRDIKQALMDDWECQELLFDEEDTNRVYERVKQVLHADRKIRHPYSLSTFYGPTTETIKEGAFIPKKIDDMMEAEVDPNIPIMAGITKNEGIHSVSCAMKRSNNKMFESWVSESDRFLRLLVDTLRWSPDTAMKCMGRIKEKYFAGGLSLMTDSQKKLSLSKMFHDIYFHRFYDNFKFGPEKTLHKNLFLYKFEHFSELSAVKREKMDSVFSGITTHGDDLKYLYLPRTMRKRCHRVLEEGPDHNPEIKRVMNHMCSLWANFCKTGVPKSDFAPDVKWRPHTEEEPHYLQISNDLILINESMCQADWDWWNKLLSDHPQEKSPPPTP